MDAQQYVAKIYDIYDSYLQSKLTQDMASDQIKSIINGARTYLNTTYPNTQLIFPDKSDIIHINQVYDNPDNNTRINVVFTLTPGGFGKYPLVLTHPGIFVYEKQDGDIDCLSCAVKPLYIKY